MRASVGLSIVILSLLSTAVVAEKISLGLSLGEVDYELNTSGEDINYLGVDDTDFAYALFGIYQLRHGLDIKLSYTDLGALSVTLGAPSGLVSPGPQASIRYETKGVSLSILNQFKLTKNTIGFAEWGKYNWKATGESQALNFIGGVFSGVETRSLNKDGTDTFYGFGLSRKIGRSVLASLSTTRYKLQDDKTKLIAFSLSFTD